jgi:hypothetical protein
VESIEELTLSGYEFQQPGRQAYFLLDPHGKLLDTYHPMLGVDCENSYVFSYGVSGWKFLKYTWKESAATETQKEQALEDGLKRRLPPFDREWLLELMARKIDEASASRFTSGRMADRVKESPPGP